MTEFTLNGTNEKQINGCERLRFWSLLQFGNNGLRCLTLNPDLRAAFPRNHKFPPKKLNFSKKFKNNDDLEIEGERGIKYCRTENLKLRNNPTICEYKS
jgi:hypothetical protein